MKLVEDNHSVRWEWTMRQQTIRKDAFGHVPKPGVFTAGALEANLIAHDLSETFAPFGSHALGGHASSQSARL